MKGVCLFLLVSSGVNGWLMTDIFFNRYKTDPCKQTYDCMTTCSRQARYTTECGLFGWSRCTRYRTEYAQCTTSCERCCDGYTGSQCNYAICGGGHGQSACNRNEGRQIYQTKVVTNSGGFCKTPMQCVDCNYGYYSSVGYCKACRQIKNCNLKNCTEYSQTICEECDGELRREERGFNAFTSLPDNKQCQRTCSWRDEYRCFPGKCPNTTYMLFPQDCECARGFGGHNCATANKDSLPQINEQSMELASDVKLFLEISNANVKTWTNENNWKFVTIFVKASYVPSFSASDKPPYINNYTIGMDQVNVSATLIRRDSSSSWKIDTNCTLEPNCIVNKTKDIHTTSPWTILQGAFQHQDEITFRVDAKNGGTVEYNDRELDRNLTYNLTGVTNTSILVLGFDMEAPKHCYEMKSPSACSGVPLQAKDFNTDKYITVSWDDWHDPDSGLSHIVFNLYLLEAKDNLALDYKVGFASPDIEIQYSETVKSKDLEFDEPGPYSIELIMYDLAGNQKMTRRIVMFDDNSTVDLQGVPIKVIEATDSLWINRSTKSLELNWKGRFINQRHFANNWLAEVKEIENLSMYLDDTKRDSARNIDAIKNINGIVRFDIGFIEELDGRNHSFDFTPATTTEFDEQRRIFKNVQLTDGKRLTYTVRGYDCMETFAEESVTVMIDLSPPVIRNLWLTKGNFLNISVHSVTELQNVTIEWEVYDTHSGIHTVLWKMFDNFTGILHGYSNERPQGETKVQVMLER